MWATLLISILIARLAAAGPVNVLRGMVDKAERWDDRAMSEAAKDAHAPVEVRPKRASCEGTVVDGQDVVTVRHDEDAVLTLARQQHHAEASRLMQYCGRAIFRAQQSGAGSAKIPFRQFVNDDPKLPTNGFLVPAIRVGLKKDPFSNLAWVLNIDGGLPLVTVPPGQVETLRARIEKAKADRQLISIDWSHPVDVAHHPLVQVRDPAVANAEDDAVAPPGSAN